MSFVKFASAAIVLFLLTGCNQDTKFSLEKMPQEYRDCASRVVPELKKGSLTSRELILAYAELKRYAHTQNACLRGAIKWADAQYQTYYQSF